MMRGRTYALHREPGIMMRTVALVCVLYSAASPVFSQEKTYALYIDASQDYGISDTLPVFSELGHCQKPEKLYPWPRLTATATIQKQGCFSDDERNNRVTVIALFDYNDAFVALLALVFERAEDSAMRVGRKKYVHPRLLVSDGIEERGEATKQWKPLIVGVDLKTYLRPRAENVFGKLCAHYRLLCTLRRRR